MCIYTKRESVQNKCLMDFKIEEVQDLGPLSLKSHYVKPLPVIWL